ncbi:hypothetical protein CYMTET_12799 [Cymbomonas tetramitiformis]|uniref:J domain-containing protein n=1 Tax=Cymbomonas tetramitiformis TaxID=36881 RepID=A0AAE0GKY9_9CHLO|nr:hypothetical protein CYMTET_12799 [Cymbomonas tetramitiformis]
MASPLVAGLSVAAAALTARGAIVAYNAWLTAPRAAKAFYKGGFEAVMTKREASLILGVREAAKPDKIKAAHRKIMIANHPDAGGNDFMASKINEAKELLLGKGKGPMK